MAKSWYRTIESDVGYSFSGPQPAGMVLVTDNTELKRLIKKQYIEREVDGGDFYNDFRSRLYMEILSGEITPAEAFAVETHLKSLKDELITGNWLTAQNVSTGLTISGIYDQALKDEIQVGIDTYITDNY